MGLQSGKRIERYKILLQDYWKIIKEALVDSIHFKLTYKSINAVLFLLVVTLPFVNRVSKLMGIVYLILFVRMALRDSDFSLPKTHQLFLGSLGVVIAVGLWFNSVDMVIGFRKVMYLAIFISLYYATLYFLTKRIISLKMIGVSIVIAMTIYMIDGYVQFFYGYDFLFHNIIQQGGVNGVSRNRNVFAFALLFYIAVLTYITIEHRKKYSMILLVAAIGLIVLTLSRQIWLASALFFLVIFIYRFKQLKVLQWNKVIIWGLLLFVLAWLFWHIPEVHQRIILMEQGYSSGRLELWKLLLSHISESPIWGHGFQSPLNVSGAEKEYDYAHNLTIGILFNLGILGIILYMIFIIYFLSILLKCKNKQYQPYFVALFIALIFVQQQLGGSMLIHKFIGPAIMLFLAMITSCCSHISIVKAVVNKSSDTEL